MNNDKWYEELCLPGDRRPIVQSPWIYDHGILATNGWNAVWLEQLGTYPTVDGDYTYALDRLFRIIKKGEAPRKTTVAALRDWAGDYTMKRCRHCAGAGYIDCPECHGKECTSCDYDGIVGCPQCDTRQWVEFDHKCCGELGGSIYNLKIIASIINHVAAGTVDVYIPPRDEKDYPESGLVLMGDGWKAAFMGMRNKEGNPFTGWVD